MARPLRRRGRARGAHARVRLRRAREEALHHRDERSRRGLLRRRRRWLGRRAGAERHAARGRDAPGDGLAGGPGAGQPSLSQQPRRNLPRHDRAGGLRQDRLRVVRVRRGLRQRRRPRPVRDLLRQERPLPQPRCGPFRRRHGEGGARGAQGSLGVGLQLRGLRPRRAARSVRRELPRVRPRAGAGARPGHELPLERRPGQLRPEGTAHRHEPPLPAARPTARSKTYPRPRASPG